ncbi:MAG: class II fructose-bisphosphate aldolase [Defluviitaleaceae bacterium]|nr:class II fructose-bisphosphate aldolase [Defluviitaleaceae bacterium]
MALVTMKEMLVTAREKGYAIGAFEFWSLDSAQAVVEAAAELNMPVILQAGLIECEFAAGIQNLYKIAKCVADDAPIPVALHLDHAETYEFICRAIDAGFTSVMFDGSALPYAENLEITGRVVEAARRAGVSVEAELGRLAGSEGNISVGEEEAMQTDPDEAFAFVRDTGVDALAVAIGTAHGFYTFTPKINISRLKEIAAKVDVPLVLHGGSGTPDDKVAEAIKNGISKVNICTEFVAAFGKAYIQTQQAPGFKYSIPGLFGPSKAAGKKLAYEKIKFFAQR